MNASNSVADAVLRTRDTTRIWTSPNGVVHAVALTGWCATCGRYDHFEESATVPTLDLVPGDRVQLPGGIVRTVSEISKTNLVNRDDLPIYAVMYQEGCTSKWSGGNSAIAATRWTVLR